MSRIYVRPAADSDAAAIDAVHRAAFPTDVEARLVALLIERDKATISLVAEVDGQIAGHILFSPATVHRSPHAPREDYVSRSETPTMSGLGLAPVAVLPAYQNQGLGSSLVRAGLAECRCLARVGPTGPVGPERGPLVPRAEALPTSVDSTIDVGSPPPPLAEQADHMGVVATWVVLLGHETYYPRFGFAPASRWNLTGDYGDSDAFQFLPLTPAADSICGGHIRYAPEFGELFSQDS